MLKVILHLHWISLKLYFFSHNKKSILSFRQLYFTFHPPGFPLPSECTCPLPSEGTCPLPSEGTCILIYIKFYIKLALHSHQVCMFWYNIWTFFYHVFIIQNQMMNESELNSRISHVDKYMPVEESKDEQEKHQRAIIPMEIDKPEYHEIEFEPFESHFHSLADIPKNTLDDGICATLGKEMSVMCSKFGYVISLKSNQDSNQKLMRNSELWGPFFMFVIFSLLINNPLQIFFLFLTLFGGAIIVTFNIKILGGQISFWQSITILGYCIFPLFVATFILAIMKLLNLTNLIIRLVPAVLGGLWCILGNNLNKKAARTFISVNVQENRRFVALYPICLFYVLVGALVVYI